MRRPYLHTRHVRIFVAYRWILLLVLALVLSLVCILPQYSAADSAAANPQVAAKVRVAFGRECEALVIDALGNAKKSVDIAIYSFARKRIADALRRCARRRVAVRMKMDAEQAKFKYTRELIRKMKQEGIRIETITMPAGQHMHHKFAIIDRKLIITGSFNWTRQASQENWENAVTIQSRKIAKRFRREWNKVGSRDADDAE